MSLIKKIAQLMLEVVFRGIRSQEEADILYHSLCKKKKKYNPLACYDVY